MNSIFTHQSQIVEPECGPEPSLHEILIQYYENAGFGEEDSEVLAQLYIDEIEKEFF